MNDAVLTRSSDKQAGSRRQPRVRTARKSSAFYGYSLTILAIGIGWLLRDAGFVTPKQGIGYWLGIVGGSLMLLLLLYPLRKRVRIFRVLGGTAKWFRVHMIFGVLGPLLVLYHSNFSLGSFNSRVAMFCMLMVAGSGVIGRHIYAHIHRGLYGEKVSLKELRSDLSSSLDKSHGLATLMPKFTEELEEISRQVQGDEITGSLGTRVSLGWTFKQYYVWWTLRRTALAELSARAAESPAIDKDFQKIKRSTTTYIRNFSRMTGRVAQFTLYERLFSLWHVLHLPLFFMMVISAIVHVLAVHMY